MQAKNYDGTFGKALKFEPITLREMLELTEVEHVEVFKATDKEIKKHNKFHLGKRFKKAPTIQKNEQN